MAACSRATGVPCPPLHRGRPETSALPSCHRLARFKGRRISFRIARLMSCRGERTARTPANYSRLRSVRLASRRDRPHIRLIAPSLSSLAATESSTCSRSDAELSRAVHPRHPCCPARAAHYLRSYADRQGGAGRVYANPQNSPRSRSTPASPAFRALIICTGSGRTRFEGNTTWQRVSSAAIARRASRRSRDRRSRLLPILH